MAQKQQIQTIDTNTTSQLDRFTLGFEYDKTLQQVKRDVRIRTFR
ncbi:MAG TPA: hypothetical protein PK543_02295 [Candidatus Saccharibacteria bacterium]|nr:hypothetical protein [Candidatus Saccharibacteria bacterium]